MSVCEILNAKVDERKQGSDCTFNGYLEDYLGMNENGLDENLKKAFELILEEEPDAKIITNLKHEISRDAVSNQIIRYKDVFKLNTRPLITPYIIYVEHEDGEGRALMVMPYSKANYLYGKGMYYCLTEPGSEFAEAKNELVSVASENSEEIARTFSRMFTEKAGALQRTLDKKFFTNYNELKSIALEAAQAEKNEAVEVLPTLEDRTQKIYSYVVHWFLLKKVLYVQYMVNKIILKTEHDGNIKAQRNQAKLNADSVVFLSYSEMWRLGADNAQKDNNQ
jgi:hypothetical protein